MNQDEEYKSDVIANQIGAELAELRAENANLEQQLFAKDERCVELEARIDLYHGNMYDVVCDQNEKLRAENERLRKALEEIANHSWYPELNYGVTIFDPHLYEGKYYDFKEIARVALEVKG